MCSCWWETVVLKLILHNVLMTKLHATLRPKQIEVVSYRFRTHRNQNHKKYVGVSCSQVSRHVPWFCVFSGEYFVHWWIFQPLCSISTWSPLDLVCANPKAILTWEGWVLGQKSIWMGAGAKEQMDGCWGKGTKDGCWSKGAEGAEAHIWLAGLSLYRTIEM